MYCICNIILYFRFLPPIPATLRTRMRYIHPYIIVAYIVLHRTSSGLIWKFQYGFCFEIVPPPGDKFNASDEVALHTLICKPIYIYII